MTAEERIDAAVRLEDVDRTPLIVGCSGPFIAQYKGMSVAEAYEDIDTIVKGEADLWDALGGWDARYGVVGLHAHDIEAPPSSAFWAIRRMMPGVDLPDNIDVQNDEKEIMKEDEYDRLLEIGWDDFFLELVNRLGKPVTQDMVRESGSKRLERSGRAIAAFKQKGGRQFLGPTGVMDPATMLATWRSYVPFTRDLHRKYDKVRAAIDHITSLFFERFRENMRHSEIRRMMVPAARYVIPVVSPKIFEEIQWSWMKGAAEIAIGEGVTPVFHLDSDWTETLPYFRELPKGTCIIHFGGETDVFKAKEILKGHMCIMGDASPAMISVCSPKEVQEYYRRLVDEIGKDGGYIMCEGCYLPATAKFENVKAMVDVAKNFLPG